MKTALLLSIGLLVLAGQLSAATKNVCTSLFYIGRNATDCSKWVICIFGAPLWFNCPAATVYNLKSFGCVQKGSAEDDCPSPVTPSPADRCKSRSGQSVFAKPDNCAQFYNCSLTPRTPGPGYLGDYVDECPYPNLFSEATGKCEKFYTVTCGSRKEIKYACNYQKLQCPGRCRDCPSSYPDCRGLSDGLQVWSARPNSPYHAYCFRERGTPRVCPSVNGKIQLFFPPTRTCKEASELFN